MILCTTNSLQTSFFVGHLFIGLIFAALFMEGLIFLGLALG